MVSNRRAILPLTRPPGLDDDHSVGASHPVNCRVGGVLEHLYGGDVVWIEPAQAPVGSRLDGNVIEHVQRLRPGVERPGPRMRTATPPSGVRSTSTPGKRPMITSSIGLPGAKQSISSDVTVLPGQRIVPQQAQTGAPPSTSGGIITHLHSAHVAGTHGGMILRNPWGKVVRTDS